MGTIMVYAKIDPSTHSALLEVASRTGKAVTAFNREAIEMHIDRVNSAEGRDESPDRVVDGLYNKAMMRKRSIEKIAAMALDPKFDKNILDSLMAQFDISEEDVERKNNDKDTKRNNCRYFLRGLLYARKMNIQSILKVSRESGFGESQTRRSLVDVAVSIRDSESGYLWELKTE